MSNCSGFQCPQVDPVFCDPIVVVQDFFYPQVVPVVHTIQVVKRHHCVPVSKHIYNYVTTDEAIEERVGVSGRKSKSRNVTMTKSKLKSKSKR